MKEQNFVEFETRSAGKTVAKPILQEGAGKTKSIPINSNKGPKKVK